MGQVTRVLDDTTVRNLDEYRAIGGGSGLAMASEMGRSDVIEHIATAGLRGRGGAGFPTGLKWQTVADSATGDEPITVVVNGAEGEPGTFKDRQLIRRNPYRVLEGALIAAYAMAAPSVIVALKASFEREAQRMRDAIADLDIAGIATDVSVRIVEGPNEYLFGEETALLEVIDGGQPFPRVAPPFRRGIAPGHHAPVLVDNVETLANVPNILAAGPDWFREIGTPSSPGSIVCTVSGDTRHHGVAEFEMGTSVGEVIETIGGKPHDGHHHIAAIAGTANPLIIADDFDTPMTYEAMGRIGSGLGTGGLIVFDDTRDLVAIAQAVAHFLAIESCGQCEPCKLDGRAIAADLELMITGDADESTLTDLRRRVNSVAVGARCALARQQEYVVGDILVRCRSELEQHLAADAAAEAVGPVLIAPIADLVDDRFVLDDAYLTKQPDWTHDEVDSGESPVDRLADVPVSVDQPATAQEPAPPQPEPPAGDPFEAVAALQEQLRGELGDVLFQQGNADAAANLEHDLKTYIDVTERIVYPMLQRVASVGDDTIWSAGLKALDAVDVAECLRGESPDMAERPILLDRLANDVRQRIADDRSIVFPLLRQRLPAADQTELANAIDEVLVES